MKPMPFDPVKLNGNESYERDRSTGEVWHCTRYRTPYADTDRSKVVYHANYLRYYDLGRTSLMRDAAYSYKEVEEDGYLYPIIEVNAKFFSPLRYDDLMWIYTRPGLLERVRIQFDYVILNEKKDIVCKGFTKHCAVNTSGIPVAVDDKTVQLWKVFPK